jgi:hypothetical protein
MKVTAAVMQLRSSVCVFSLVDPERQRAVKGRRRSRRGALNGLKDCQG